MLFGWWGTQTAKDFLDVEKTSVHVAMRVL